MIPYDKILLRIKYILLQQEPGKVVYLGMVLNLLYYRNIYET
jgi:hypothetical protein